MNFPGIQLADQAAGFWRLVGFANFANGGAKATLSNICAREPTLSNQSHQPIMGGIISNFEAQIKFNDVIVTISETLQNTGIATAGGQQMVSKQEPLEQSLQRIRCMVRECSNYLSD